MTIAAIRFNNPGDVSLPIKGWTGVGYAIGIKGQPGYGKFPTMEIGYQAFLWRLKEYIMKGCNTIRKIGALYATDPNWPKEVAQIAGLPIGVILDPDDETQMQPLASAIIRQETGMTLAELEEKSKEYHHVT